MHFPSQKIYLIRHGETPWSLSGQHTGKTDISLTEQGIADAEKIGNRLKGHHFEKIFVSPMKRAQETCALSGMLKHAYTEDNLMEWDYGDYEGLTTQEIWKTDPEWNLFSRGAPNGESVTDVAARANRLLSKLHSYHGDLALFSHGHFLRVLAARYLGLSAQEGKLFTLSPSSISILSFERNTPVIALWNQTSHLMSS
jgi:probable phosphoglycerate mutase